MPLTLPQEIGRAQLMVETLARTAQRRPSVLIQRDLARWERRLARLETVRGQAKAAAGRVAS